MRITANKGEWSELYVLFKLLGEKKIHAGDGKLNKLKEYYPVISVIRDELERHLEYAIDNTSLPEKPNYEAINEFLMSVNERVVNGTI